ncbi:hypothetical protein TNCV_2668421 [Trichonephila clavipes]|nr:hypothetical protein TNCV_2668421 [Trichonephila clavipes]
MTPQDDLYYLSMFVQEIQGHPVYEDQWPRYSVSRFHTLGRGSILGHDKVNPALHPYIWSINEYHACLEGNHAPQFEKHSPKGAFENSRILSWAQ